MISVIIPVYNAAGFLEKCIQSVLTQSYQQIEVILVDDGSCDNSLSLCREFASRDSRVKVIHQENRGVSAARNIAIEHVTGEYVVFVDADDYLESDYLQVLLKSLLEHDADMSCCNFYEELNGMIVEFETPKVLKNRLVCEREELLGDLARGQECYGTCVWGKMIRADFVKKCRFRPLKFGEDQVFMYELFSLDPVVYLDTYKGYHYVRNENSATVHVSICDIFRCLDEVQMRRIMLEELPIKDSQLEAMYLERYAASLHQLARAVELTGDGQQRKEYRTKLIRWIDEITGNSLSVKLRIYLLLYRYIPWLYRNLLRLRLGKIQS